MIKENVQKLLAELPEGVELEAACKGRTPGEILEAIEAGIKIIGENYVQEGEAAFETIGRKARWHFIGHLQKNKVKKAVRLFDMIETVDSFELAEEINRASLKENKIMQVLIEVNSGKERQKSGIFPEEAECLARRLSELDNIKVLGLMTMGPMAGDSEDARPYFVVTKNIFANIKGMGLPNIEMKYLSMGMSNSYKVAIEEGANIIRLGTAIFGSRPQ
jgi:pyridoxal phosphate enzyme (YggS family)